MKTRMKFAVIIAIVVVLLLSYSSTTFQMKTSITQKKDHGPYAIPAVGTLDIPYEPGGREEYVIPNFPYYKDYDSNGLTPCSVAAILKYYDNKQGSNFIPYDNIIFSIEHVWDYTLPRDYAEGTYEYDESWYGDPHPNNCIADFLHTSRFYDRNWAGLTDYWFAYGEPREPSFVGRGIETYCSWRGLPVTVDTYDFATYGAFKSLIDQGIPVLVAFCMKWFGQTVSAPTFVVPVIGYKHDILNGDQIGYRQPVNGEMQWVGIVQGGWQLMMSIGQVYVINVPSSWPSKIQITYPIGAEGWKYGETHLIKWNSQNGGNSVKIELLNCWGQTQYWWLVNGNAPNTGSYQYTQWHDEKNFGYMFKITDLQKGVSCIGDTFSVTPVETNNPGRETWGLGTTHQISWKYVSHVNYVRLELHGLNNYTLPLETNLPNTGSYNWFIPLTVPVGDYKIKVKDISCEGYDYTERTISIVGQSTSTVITPNGGDQWKRGSHDIKWSWTGDIKMFDVELYRNNQFVKKLASNFNSGLGGSFTWKVTTSDPIDNTYRIKIIGKDSNGGVLCSDTSNADFSLIAGFTNIEVTSHDTNSYYKVTKSTTISWTSGTTGNVRIELYKGDSLSLIIKSSIASRVGTNTFVWKIPSTVASSSGYKIKISDTKDLKNYDFSEIFSIGK